VIVTDSHPATGAQTAPPIQEAPPAFPVVRLLYAIGFAFVAWLVFWILLLLGLVQFLMLALSGRVNEELRRFSVNLAQYLWEVVAYILFLRDEQPFPIGAFPSRSS
jgi:hypothetical protein